MKLNLKQFFVVLTERMVSGKKGNSIWFYSSVPQYYPHEYLSFLYSIDFLLTNLVIRFAFVAPPFLGQDNLNLPCRYKIWCSYYRRRDLSGKVNYHKILFILLFLVHVCIVVDEFNGYSLLALKSI